MLPNYGVNVPRSFIEKCGLVLHETKTKAKKHPLKAAILQGSGLEERLLEFFNLYLSVTFMKTEIDPRGTLCLSDSKFREKF